MYELSKLAPVWGRHGWCGCGSYSKLTYTTRHDTRRELVRVREYVFRFDYGAFWMGRPMALGSPHTRLSPATLALFLASAPCLRFALG